MAYHNSTTFSVFPSLRRSQPPAYRHDGKGFPESLLLILTHVQVFCVLCKHSSFTMMAIPPPPPFLFTVPVKHSTCSEGGGEGSQAEASGPFMTSKGVEFLLIITITRSYLCQTTASQAIPACNLWRFLLNLKLETNTSPRLSMFNSETRKKNN